MRPSVEIKLTVEEHSEPGHLARRRTVRRGRSYRTQVAIPATGGLTNPQIDNAPDVTDRTVGKGRSRFAEHRPGGPGGEPRSPGVHGATTMMPWPGWRAGWRRRRLVARLAGARARCCTRECMAPSTISRTAARPSGSRWTRPLWTGHATSTDCAWNHRSAPWSLAWTGSRRFGPRIVSGRRGPAGSGASSPS